MEWTIRPLQSVGPVAFGIARADVRRAVGARFREFVKSPGQSSNTTDAFDELLVHVSHAVNGDTCEFVEFGGGAARPMFQGKDLLRDSFSDLRDWFRSLDSTMTEDEGGLECRTLGIGLYAPYAEEDPNRPPEGVSVFKRGHATASG